MFSRGSQGSGTFLLRGLLPCRCSAVSGRGVCKPRTPFTSLSSAYPSQFSALFHEQQKKNTSQVSYFLACFGVVDFRRREENHPGGFCCWADECLAALCCSFPASLDSAGRAPVNTFRSALGRDTVLYLFFDGVSCMVLTSTLCSHKLSWEVVIHFLSQYLKITVISSFCI